MRPCSCGPSERVHGRARRKLNIVSLLHGFPFLRKRCVLAGVEAIGLNCRQFTEGKGKHANRMHRTPWSRALMRQGGRKFTSSNVMQIFIH